MNKIWLIIQREYVTRVKNKTFLLTTLLAPIGFLLMFAVLGFLMSRGSDDNKNIYVIDESNLLQESIDTRKNLTFTFSEESLEDLKQKYKEKTLDGILVIPAVDSTTATKFGMVYYSDEQLALDEQSSIESAVRKRIRNYKLQSLNIDQETLKSLDTKVSINPETIFSDKKITSITSAVGGILGAVVGYAMFFIILIYGMQVMRSVMEEKINRIVEVLISSITPFQLMMGKVIGVGLVGLTQIGLWLILFPIIFTVGTAIIGVDTSAVSPEMNLPPEVAEAAMSDGMGKIAAILQEISALNWWLITPLMLFYFLFGYFAYASLFAAIGSAVGEDINEAQSLTFPIMIPLIIAVYIGVSALSAPHGSIAVWASMIPLLSSIVMPVRLPSDPAAWQIIVSVISLLAFSVFFVWLAGRIYRVGILLYGKKASLKELSKWVFYKG